MFNSFNLRFWLFSIPILLSFCFASTAFGQVYSEGEFDPESGIIAKKRKSTRTISARQKKKIKLYPDQSILSKSSSESDKILEAQFEMQLPFLIEAIYLGNNSSFIPGVIIRTPKLFSDPELEELQKNLYLLLDKFGYGDASVNTLVYRKEKMYRILSSAKQNSTVRIYDFAPIQSLIVEQLELLPKIASGKYSKIKDHEILEIYWFVVPYVVDKNLKCTFSIISQDSKDIQHMSRMDWSINNWRIDYFGPIQKQSYGFDYRHSIGGYKRTMPGIPTVLSNYVYTYYGSLVVSTEEDRRVEEKKYLRPFNLRVK